MTIQTKIEFENPKDKDTLIQIMQRQSSCMHSIYKLLTKNIKINEKEFQKKFDLNSWYARSAHNEAKALYQAQIELERDPNRVIFGSKKLFNKLKKRHLNEKQRKEIKRKYQEKRKYNLYSIGEKNLDGNRNLTIKGKNLKINVGDRNHIFGKIITKDKRWYDLLLAEKYTVKLQIRNNELYASFSFEQDMQDVCINFLYGCIGIDLNASPSNIAWAELNHEGNYLDSGTIGTPELYDCRKNKRNYYVFHYAHQIVKLALMKNKAIVIEDLNTGGPNRVLSNFCRSKLAYAIEVTARRFGVLCYKVYPHYTSVIGCLKYSPIYNLSRHESAAIAIGRRGMGYKEKLPKSYKNIKIEENKSFACNVSNANVTQKKKEVGSPLKKFGGIYKVCRIAVLTEQFTVPKKKVLPNWNILKRYLISGEDSKLKKLVPFLACGTECEFVTIHIL